MGIEDNINSMYGKLGNLPMVWPKDFLPRDPTHDDWPKGIPHGSLFIRPEIVKMVPTFSTFGKSTFMQEMLRRRLLEKQIALTHIAAEGPDFDTIQARTNWHVFDSLAMIIDEMKSAPQPQLPFRPTVSMLTFAIRKVTADYHEERAIHIPTYGAYTNSYNVSVKPVVIMQPRSVGKSVPVNEIYRQIVKSGFCPVKVTDRHTGEVVPFELYGSTIEIKGPMREVDVNYLAAGGKTKPAWNPPPKFTGLKRKK